MIVYVTMTKYKDFAAGHSNQENMQQAKALVEALAGRVPTLLSVEVGLNILHNPTDFDSTIRTEYKTLEDLQSTLTHPEHLKVTSFMEQVVDTNHTVTYERAE